MISPNGFHPQQIPGSDVRVVFSAGSIDRLNIGAIPTIKLNWLQPHEGSIVDFLFRQRAFQTQDPGPGAIGMCV